MENAATHQGRKVEMKPQFAHYWQEGVILNVEERGHKEKITQAMNQGFVYTVPEGSPDKWARFNCTQQYELQEMMLREHDAPSHLMSFFFVMKTKQMMNLPSGYVEENLLK